MSGCSARQRPKVSVTCIICSTSHSRRFVQPAELDPGLSRETKTGKGFTAVMCTALKDDIDHSLQLVLAAKHAPSRARDVACGLFGAARVHAVLVTDIHHPILNVFFAIQPSGLACRLRHAYCLFRILLFTVYGYLQWPAESVEISFAFAL